MKRGTKGTDITGDTFIGKTPRTGTKRSGKIDYDKVEEPNVDDPNAKALPIDKTLQFESRFESGNLRKAMKVGPFEYELYLKNDYGQYDPIYGKIIPF